MERNQHKQISKIIELYETLNYHQLERQRHVKIDKVINNNFILTKFDFFKESFLLKN